MDLERRHAKHAARARLQKSLAHQGVLRARLADTVWLKLNFVDSVQRESQALQIRRRALHVQRVFFLQQRTLRSALHVLLDRTQRLQDL